MRGSWGGGAPALKMQETWAWPTPGDVTVSFPPALFLSSLLHPSPALLLRQSPLSSCTHSGCCSVTFWDDTQCFPSHRHLLPILPLLLDSFHPAPQPLLCNPSSMSAPIPLSIEIFRRGITTPFPQAPALPCPTCASLWGWALSFLSEVPLHAGPPFSSCSVHTGNGEQIVLMPGDSPPDRDD